MGYKKASTDSICKAAGISKGLLFHYFGTKENLYNFLIEYAIEVMTSKYLGRIDIGQGDVLQSIWQMAVLKGEISVALPAVFDFVTSVYLESGGAAGNEGFAKMMRVRAEVMAKVQQAADLSLFKADIAPPHRAIQIINWAIDGYAKSLTAATPPSEAGETARENYNKYLKELEEMLDIFRRCFYE